ncbi:MAG: enoyl-CoA hydratase/isomerase family protein [Novosphingobium sp.]|nr:enoyl-CoA hydratase/isomerase family protein [Novosphingobium sp.]
MNLVELTIDAGRLWPGEALLDAPLAFVDLVDARDWPDVLALPPCPIIGIGPRDHPLAALLDAVIEPPVSADMIARAVLGHPEAAAVTVQLLRLLPALAVEDALTTESLAYGLLQGSTGHRAWIAAQAPADIRGEGCVRVERHGGRLSITLDRSARGNAIDRTMRDGLYEAFALAALDPEIRAVVLRGEGRTFSLGAELAEFGTTTDPAAGHAIRARTLPARMIARCADRLEVHVQGGCVGAGLEMAAWAKDIFATPEAWFQLPELAMGILPGAGGCVALSRRIGRQRTALMILSGKRIGAPTALEWGLVDHIVNKAA